MEHRYLGRTGLAVSQLCLGTMAFGAEADEQTATQIFAAARDAGVNLVDCADVYATGASEEILGRLLKGCRDEMVVCTKGYFPTGPGPNARGSSRFHLVRAVEASLRRLDTDRIDIYYLHRMDDVTAVDETLRELERLVTAGKILYPAVSNFAAWQTTKALGVAAAHGWAPVVVTQPMYNLVKRQAEVEILPMCRAEQLGCIPYGPLGGGLLSGKYGRDRKPATGRLVDNAMYGVRYGEPDNYAVAERFVALATEVGCTPVALAVAWVAAHPAVTAPLIGARSVQQLQGCLAAAEVRMTPELYAAVSACSPTPPPATDRNEEGSTHNYGSR